MKEDDVIELDLKQLVLALWKKAWLLILAAIVCGLVAFGVTRYAITPMYRADVKIYVNNSSISLGSTSVSISGSDISAAKTLVSTYIVILESRTTLNEIIEQGNLPYTTSQLSEMISASSVDDTEIFQIDVINPDPALATEIANIIAEILPEKIASIVDGSAVRIVDYAVQAASPYSPSYTTNIALGMLIGFVISAGFVVLITIFDDVIDNEDMLTQEFDIPVLAAIPDVMHEPSGAKYKHYYRKTPQDDTHKKGGEL